MSDKKWEPIGPNDDENDFVLIHHGIKGMKWGVRRAERRAARAAIRTSHESQMSTPAPTHHNPPGSIPVKLHDGRDALMVPVNQPVHHNPAALQRAYRQPSKMRAVGRGTVQGMGAMLATQFAAGIMIGKGHTTAGLGLAYASYIVGAQQARAGAKASMAKQRRNIAIEQRLLNG